MTSLVNALANRMDYLVDRQDIVSGNIANANTPGYLERDIEFKKYVDHDSTPSANLSMAETESGHIAGAADSSPYQLEVQSNSKFMRHDGNSVQLDVEMQKLNQIQLNYNMVTQLYNKQRQFQELMVRQ